jgi:hypothetical protein
MVRVMMDGSRMDGRSRKQGVMNQGVMGMMGM